MRPEFRIGGFRIPPSDLIFILVFLIAALATAFGKISLRWHKVFKAVAAYTIAMAAAATFSENPGLSFVKLLGIIYLAFILFITFNVLDSYQSLYCAAKVWIYASTIAALIASVAALGFYLNPESSWFRGFLHHYGSLPPGNYPRVQGTFFYPAMLCNYFTVSLALLFALREANQINQKFFVISLCLHLFGVAFTLTPGLGGLILLVSVFVGIALYRGNRLFSARIALATGIAGALLFLAAAAFSLSPIETSPYTFNFLGQRFDPTQRLLTWQESLRTFIQYPVIGRGPALPSAEVLFKAPSGQLQMLTDAHQSWLNIAAQAGIIGLAAFVWLTIALYKCASEQTSLRTANSAFRFWLLMGFMTAFLYQGLVGSFEDARHLWAFFGFIVSAAEMRDS